MVKCLACGGHVETRDRRTCPNCGLAFTPEQTSPIEFTPEETFPIEFYKEMYLSGIISVNQIVDPIQLKADWLMTDRIRR